MGQQEDFMSLAADAVQFKQRLFKNGLFASAQLMDDVITKIGWEIADAKKKITEQLKAVGLIPRCGNVVLAESTRTRTVFCNRKPNHAGECRGVFHRQHKKKG